MVSALKVGGKRLYELARRGEEIERAPRRVVVHAIELVELGALHADIRVRCGRGCYVRSLAHDLGRRLDVPAHLGSLRRGGIGRFRVENASRLEDLQAWIERGAPAAEAGSHGVLALGDALDFLPSLRLRTAHEAAVRHGVQPTAATLCGGAERTGTHLLWSEDGRRLLGLVDVEGRPQVPRLRLLRIFQEPIPASDPECD